MMQDATWEFRSIGFARSDKPVTTILTLYSSLRLCVFALNIERSIHEFRGVAVGLSPSRGI
jgi:hypothetical protein